MGRSLLVMVMVGALMGAVPASGQEGDGYIEGVVVNEATGLPVEVSGVNVFSDSSGGPWSSPTAADGSYRIGPLPAGTYFVLFVDEVGLGHLDEWWRDKPNIASADPVEVVAGQTTTGIDFAVERLPGGYIEGSIIDEGSGLPARESVFGAAALGVNVFDLSGRLLGASEPLATGGKYWIGPLPAGSYKLQYVDNYSEYETEWWQDKASFADANPVEVIEGKATTGIDFMVARIAAPGAWVEGQLTIVGTGQPVPAGFRLFLGFHDAALTPQIGDADLTGPISPGRVAWTDEEGRYRLGPVPAGTYKVILVDSSWFAFEGVACPCTGWDGTPAMLMGWWNDKADFASADVVEIRANEVTVLDFSLRRVGVVPGPSPPSTISPEELPFTGNDGLVALLAGSALLLIGIGSLRVLRRATAGRAR